MGNALEKLISDPVNTVCTILSGKCVNITGIFKNFSGGAHENAQQFDTVRLDNKLKTFNYRIGAASFEIRWINNEKSSI